MKIKHLFSKSLIVVMILSFSSELDAQRRGTKKREDRSERSRSSRDRDSRSETIPLRDRMIYDIHIGQLGFNQGFQISAKGGAAYKFNNIFSLGLGLKTFYYAQNLPGNSFDGSLFDYGVYVYPRIKVSEQFYIKGEYYYISKDFDFENSGNADRRNEFFPLIGAGYLSGFGPWKFGLELLYIATSNDNKDSFFYGDFFEYMFTFTYNF